MMITLLLWAPLAQEKPWWGECTYLAECSHLPLRLFIGGCHAEATQLLQGHSTTHAIMVAAVAGTWRDVPHADKTFDCPAEMLLC